MLFPCVKHQYLFMTLRRVKSPFLVKACRALPSLALAYLLVLIYLFLPLVQPHQSCCFQISQSHTTTIYSSSIHLVFQVENLKMNFDDFANFYLSKVIKLLKIIYFYQFYILCGKDEFDLKRLSLDCFDLFQNGFTSKIILNRRMLLLSIF